MIPETYNLLIELLKSSPDVEGIALGGSRARNNEKLDSDFDIFVIVYSETFDTFLDSFSKQVENEIPKMIFFGKDKYLEDWGYMFCGIDDEGFFYDVAFITPERIKEMAIRSENRILYDTDNLLKKATTESQNINYKTQIYLKRKEPESVRMFYINLVRFIKFFKKEDYWMTFRFVNLLRENLLKCYRTEINTPSKLYFLPEECFEIETKNLTIRENFYVDGKIETLKNTAIFLINAFRAIYPHDIRISVIEKIFQFELDKK